MGVEIERKFLVINDDWRARVSEHFDMRQGYLASAPDCSIRVRISADNAYLNIKGATLTVRRKEYEYVIPLQDGQELLQLCHKPLIEKRRHIVREAGNCWEIDEFYGDNAGLVVAELELEHEDEAFQRPSWLGEEVSHDRRYYNVCLVDHPYKNW